VHDLRQQLEDRKAVERAKGIVMRILRIEEEDAHQRMRRFASDRNMKLIDLARRLIDADEPFREMRRVRSC
jgi:response regulator NasT